MSRIITNYKVDYRAKNKAFPYQLDAFLAVKDMPYSAIFHEQGLGKTKIAVDLLLYWLTEKDIDTVFIVTKKQLVANWIDEFKIHTHIQPKVLSNNKNDNFYVLNSSVKVIVTNFETLSTDKSRIKLFLKCRNVAIIIDESTKLKNPTAKITKDFFELSDLFKIKTIMTGTPVANRPYDIWAQVFFLDGGENLGNDFEDFKKNTDLSNDLTKNLEKRELFQESVSNIYDKISSFSIRETKKSCGIELPEKEYESLYVEFESIQKCMYDKIVEELQIEVEHDGESIIDDDSVSLKRLLRLMQTTSNPKLLDERYDKISGKEQQLDDLIEEIIGREEKCIIWSNYIENIEYLTTKYQKYGARRIHGSLSMEDRNKSVQMFKFEESCKLLLATPQAAKEGLTLTVANNVIFYDRGFNLDDYLQAQDRIHRISQKKKCHIYNILVRDSVDEWIDKLLIAKQHAAFLAQGDITVEEYEQSVDYSFGDIIKGILNTEEE